MLKVSDATIIVHLVSNFSKSSPSIHKLPSSISEHPSVERHLCCLKYFLPLCENLPVFTFIKMDRYYTYFSICYLVSNEIFRFRILCLDFGGIFVIVMQLEISMSQFPSFDKSYFTHKLCNKATTKHVITECECIREIEKKNIIM